MRTAVLFGAIEVDRPADDVFRYGSDLRNDRDWNPDMRSVRLLTPGPIGVGSRYQARWAQSRLPMEVMYTSFEPPVRWANTVTSRRLTVGFEAAVTPRPRGSLISVRMTVSPRGGWVLMLPILRRVMRRAIGRNLARLKGVLEQPTVDVHRRLG